MIAAIGHLFARHAQSFEHRFAALPPESRNLDVGLGLPWEVVSGDSYAAVLEVVVAARTRPELRAVVGSLTSDLEGTVLDLLGSLLPDFDRESALALVDAGFALVQGAAISSFSGFGRPQRTIQMARVLARLITPQTLPLVQGLLDAVD